MQKLPKTGKKYKLKENLSFWFRKGDIAEFLGDTEIYKDQIQILFLFEKGSASVNPEIWQNIFEEIEDKPNTFDNSVDKVREAKKKLKEELIGHFFPLGEKSYFVAQKSKALLDALDEQEKHTSNSEIPNNLEKPKSIWKPISELPEAFDHYIVKGANGKIIYITPLGLDEFLKDKYGEKYMTLTDFINDYEQLKERVSKLEGK